MKSRIFKSGISLLLCCMLALSTPLSLYAESEAVETNEQAAPAAESAGTEGQAEATTESSGTTEATEQAGETNGTTEQPASAGEIIGTTEQPASAGEIIETGDQPAPSTDINEVIVPIIEPTGITGLNEAILPAEPAGTTGLNEAIVPVTEPTETAGSAEAAEAAAGIQGDTSVAEAAAGIQEDTPVADIAPEALPVLSAETPTEDPSTQDSLSQPDSMPVLSGSAPIEPVGEYTDLVTGADTDNSANNETKIDTSILHEKNTDNYTTETLTKGDLSLFMQGVPESEKEAFLDAIADSVLKDISSVTDVTSNAELIDVEKYSLVDEDYDCDLCWAAVTSNMLWSAGYAQDVVNPYTKEYFNNPDEVFDYFRNTFENKAGSSFYGIDFFVNGKYDAEGVEGCSQIKEGQEDKVVLYDGENPSICYKIESQQAKEYMDVILDTWEDYTYGLTVSLWDVDKFTGAHAVTLMGLVLDNAVEDFTEKYKGIFISDSDSNPVRGFDAFGTADTHSNEEKATLARLAKNMYKYYPLAYRVLDNVGYWTMYGYDADEKNGIYAVIKEIIYLEKKSSLTPEPEPTPEPTPEPAPTETPDNNSSSDNEQSDNNMTPTENLSLEDIIKQNEVSPELKALYEALKNQMIQNDLVVFSPDNSSYNTENGKEYEVYVRVNPSIFLNVYVDGQRLTGDGSCYKFVTLPNGMFKIVLNEEYLKKLGKGTHVLKMDFSGYNEVEHLIEVK